jgi:hypothetical protein
MARDDFTVFNKAKLAMLDGTHDLDTDVFKLALLDNTVAPTATTLTPNLSDFTEVGAAGTYTTGGTTITCTLAEAAGTVTFDSTTNPNWAQNASNDTDAYWGLIYNTSASNAAIGFLDLGGPVDMTAGDLDVTWSASGIFTMA